MIKWQSVAITSKREALAIKTRRGGKAGQLEEPQTYLTNFSWSKESTWPHAIVPPTGSLSVLLTLGALPVTGWAEEHEPELPGKVAPLLLGAL